MLARTNTADGSVTCFSERYGEHFHSLSGAATEAHEKFIVPGLYRTGLIERPSLAVLDIGFGLGYNAAAAYKAFRSRGSGHLNIDSIELDADTLAAAREIHKDDRMLCEYIDPITLQHWYSGNDVDALLYIGDARSVIASLDRKYDAVFLDAFSTKKNTELWTYDLFLKIKERLLPHGVLVTYSAAYPVISGLTAAGFIVRQTEPVGRKVGGTIASLIDHGFPAVDAARDSERRATTGRLFYRDEMLDADGEVIRARYDAEKARLLASGVPSIKHYRALRTGA